MPRSAGCRLRADLRAGPRLSRAARSRRSEAHRPDRLPSGRERLHVAGHRVRRRALARRQADRGRPALLHRRGESRLVAADPAGHRHRAAAGVDERADRRRSVRQGLHPDVRHWASTVSRATCGSSRRSGPRRSRKSPPAKIRETARAMGEAKPAVPSIPGRHATWYGDDTQRARAMAILTALTGSWGRKGGIFLPTPIETGKLRSAAVPGIRTRPRRRRRHALPVRRRGARRHQRPGRCHPDRQALPDQGLDHLRTERAGEHSAAATNDRGDRRSWTSSSSST